MDSSNAIFWYFLSAGKELTVAERVEATVLRVQVAAFSRRRAQKRYIAVWRGGVTAVVFSLYAAFMRGKIAAEINRAFIAVSRRVLRSVFPEIAFLCLCIIVLMRFSASQKTLQAAHRAATFPTNAQL